MDTVKFLIHETSLDNFHEIMKSGYLFTPYDRYLKDIKVDGCNGCLCENDLTKTQWLDHQYPGVYIAYITKGNMNYPCRGITLIFSKRLLQDRNDYHINNGDICGDINKDFTSFPDNPNIVCEEECNEIVFHSKVSLKYLVKVLVPIDEDYNIESLRKLYPNIKFELLNTENFQLNNNDLVSENNIPIIEVKSNKILRYSLNYLEKRKNEISNKRKFIIDFLIEYHSLN